MYLMFSSLQAFFQDSLFTEAVVVVVVVIIMETLESRDPADCAFKILKLGEGQLQLQAAAGRVRV